MQALREQCPQCCLTVFGRKNSKTHVWRCTWTNTIYHSTTTCLQVPKVCRCLPGRDPGVMARQLLMAQTCFLSCICHFGGAHSAVLMLHGAEVGPLLEVVPFPR